ncbi:ABC transporter ATP-binding protein [Flavimarina sp. Hel_I_48]|uniref:ABC transporter ATP-binding protein n=1 Tax=Flavimarina sp. Hel_I_48 TaxID=1392488 RepID=UPI0004DF8B37|nr:ATP-binding cassette domain-containing protein [Flavimarina sp. Hel_I_48]
MEYLLAADHVSKKFGKYTALNDLSIAVPTGSVFGLLGPNGAGKTTLIRIINQITAPDEGSVTLGGEPLQQKHILNIGYMPEERGLYKSMKVGEQLLYLAQLKGMTRSDAKSQSEYWFSRLGITGWWDKKIQELSKGQAQKIQFIVTVLHRPKLLIFDEPFSGFDPINANLIKDEILKLRDDGATIIFSTHRMESVEAMCDHIALINKSNKILDGNLAEIKRNYRSNTYEIGLETVEDTHEAQQRLNMEVTTALPENWNVTPATFKTIHDHDLKLTVQMPEGASANDLLRYLTTKGMVNHFVEVIPSVNDIFIQTISSN